MKKIKVTKMMPKWYTEAKENPNTIQFIDEFWVDISDDLAKLLNKDKENNEVV